MSGQQTEGQKGFTIIEVVLVLAIAALIFLMVFIALPALQRGQRDTARKNDASVIASALTASKGNNRGSLPTTAAAFGDFKDEYLVDPLSQYTPADVILANDTQRTGNPGNQAWVFTGDKCSTTSSDAVAGNSRTAAIRISLETGGVFCQDA